MIPMGSETSPGWSGSFRPAVPPPPALRFKLARAGPGALFERDKSAVRSGQCFNLQRRAIVVLDTGSRRRLHEGGACFADKVTEDLYHGKNSKDARRIPKSIWKVVQRKLDLLNRAASLRVLRIPPNNRLEKLRGDLEGFHSIRVNDQYRIVFAFRDGDAHDVRVLHYH